MINEFVNGFIKHENVKKVVSPPSTASQQMPQGSFYVSIFNKEKMWPRVPQEKSNVCQQQRRNDELQFAGAKNRSSFLLLAFQPEDATEKKKNSHLIRLPTQKEASDDIFDVVSKLFSSKTNFNNFSERESS